MKRIALYARVSTKDKGQETSNQLRELHTFCERQGWEQVTEYVDHVTGSASDNRPAFQRLFKDAHQRKVDLVLFWSLDRFSREGALETLKHLEKLTAYGVQWKSFTEQYLDSAGLFKDAIISIMATLAKQERIRISERTIAGLATAREKGKQLGRPRRVFDREKAKRLYREGQSTREIAKVLGVSNGTVHAAVR